MKLVDLAEDKVEIITQWGIYNSPGNGLNFYKKLEEGKKSTWAHLGVNMIGLKRTVDAKIYLEVEVVATGSMCNKYTSNIKKESKNYCLYTQRIDLGSLVD